MEQKPSVGRIVHYQHDGIAHAAIITKVWNDTGVNLAYFTESGTCCSQTSVLFGTEDNQWSWPPRV